MRAVCQAYPSALLMGEDAPSQLWGTLARQHGVNILEDSKLALV
jgi:hypothetical protein